MLTKRRNVQVSDEESDTGYRSSSSHIFTIPESTVFFHEFVFVLFFYKDRVIPRFSAGLKKKIGENFFQNFFRINIEVVEKTCSDQKNRTVF